MKIPFATISKIHITNEYLLTLVAVMLDGIETYRYLKQTINHHVNEQIDVGHIVYESTFTDRDLAYQFFAKQVVVECKTDYDHPLYTNREGIGLKS